MSKAKINLCDDCVKNFNSCDARDDDFDFESAEFGSGRLVTFCKKREPRQFEYTEADLVNFGNYVLSEKRKSSLMEERLELLIKRSSEIHNADLLEWKRLRGK